MGITKNSKQQKGGFFMEQMAIFCDADDFCKAYGGVLQKQTIDG